jgi:O-antigen/teichoic acid export membrane protein
MFRFFKDFFIYGVASIMGKLAAILLIPVYTGVLTKEEYGAMALIVSCKGIIDLFSNLNIHSGIIRDYYETEDDRTKLISTGFFSILGFSNFTLLLVLLSTNFFIEKVLGIAEFKSSFILMALSIPAGSLMSYFSILTRFKKKPIQYSIGSFVQLLVQISISLIGVVYLELGIPSIFLGVLMGEIVSIIYFSFLMHLMFAY